MPNASSPQLLTDDDPEPRDVVRTCHPTPRPGEAACLRAVLTERGLELLAAGDFFADGDVYDCRECGAPCRRHEVSP